MEKPEKKVSSKAENTFNIIYIVIFFAVCIAPLCLWAFLKNDTPIGNAELAPFPEVTDKDGKFNFSFFSQFDDYFTEHLPLRPQLVTADNYLKAELLGGNTSNVIQGKNGYIFSSETVDDYVGVTCSQRKINNIARTVKLMQDKAEHTGNNFLFTVIPNKNSVYPQYMPSRYIKSETNDLSLLEKELKTLNVNYLDMGEVLSSYGGELYLKRDTHWNGLGALYGANAIMDALGKEHNDHNGIGYTYVNDWRGDIDKLLYPAGGVCDGQYYFDVDLSGVTFLIPHLGEDNRETLEELMSDREKYDTMIKTMYPQASGQLLMIRDSFCRAMLPFLIDNYRSATLTRSQPFAMNTLVEDSNTDVVYEIVERNVEMIVDSAPVMEAEETEVPESEKISAGKNTINVDKTQSFVKIYGVLDEKYFDDQSRIFVTCSGKEEHTYEAFPICETELLKLDKNSDYGYSLILDNRIPAGEYDVSVTVTSAHGNTSTGVLERITIVENSDENS